MAEAQELEAVAVVEEESMSDGGGRADEAAS
jgi:hypothetical protein